MRRGWAVFGALALAGLLHADWKIVTRTDGRDTTDYFKGKLERTDSPGGYTTVLDSGQRRQFAWRAGHKEYTVMEWPPQPPVPPAAGPVITLVRTTIDTGERKQIFGRTARHLISTTKRSDAPGINTVDGWYIDVPNLPAGKRGIAVGVLTTRSTGEHPAIPHIEVKQTGPAPTGLVVYQKMKMDSPRLREIVTEVTELQETNLPDKLFAPPDGYKRVAALSK